MARLRRGASESEAAAYLDEIAAQNRAAQANGHAPPPPSPNGHGRGAPKHEELPYMLVPMSRFERRAVEWLWRERIAVGKLTLLAGECDLGKSFAMLDLAARLSTATPLPGQSERIGPADTILFMDEDDPQDQIGPRLDNQRADSNRVHLFTGVRHGGRHAYFRLRRDLEKLERALSDVQPRLMVMDPIDNYMGGTEGISNIDVREALMPLSKLAERHRVAVVGMMHLSKDQAKSGLNRIAGSMAYRNVARCVLAVGEDPDKPGRRVMLRIKGNIAPRLTNGLGYRILDNVLYWDDEPVSATPQTIFGATNGGPAEGETEEGRLGEAVEFLQTVLLENMGHYPEKSIELEAQQRHQAWATVRRAAKRLGVQSRRRVVDGHVCWEWELPDRGSHDD